MTADQRILGSCAVLRVLVSTEQVRDKKLFVRRGGTRHFHLRGALEGPVLQQGELSMVCVGLSERDLILGGH